MRLLEVYTPEVDAYVRYKVMDPDAVEEFTAAHSDLDRDEYVNLVLETIVYNLRSEISDILRSVDTQMARRILDCLYNGCVMLNPGLDVDAWLQIAANYSIGSQEQILTPEVPPPTETEEDGDEEQSETAAKKSKKKKKKKRRTKIITKARFMGLENHLKENIVGQDEAVEALVNSLKRTIVGLRDKTRPLAVFLFAGASGIGKTEMAKQLHEYLFSDKDSEFVRIDCGEYQHKHENQKLLGAPPGYVGYDNGGHLANQMEDNSRTVVLLDEVEKAHPDIWNTFLRVFDEGVLTDGSGNEISFRESIIIMTTNLGNSEIVESITDGGVGFGGKLFVDISDADMPSRSKVERATKKSIRKSFRPEFLNRIDKVIVFNHLSGDNLLKIAELELNRLIKKLEKKGMVFSYTDEVLEKMVNDGVNPVEGARGLSRVRRDIIEDVISDVLIDSKKCPRGSALALYCKEDEFCVDVKKPKRTEQ